jgi:DHA1 family inner membrane transport protein
MLSARGRGYTPAMAFFRNNTVNLLNLHYGLHAVAMTGGGAFYAVFLLRAGVPTPAILAVLALILVGRFAIRPWILVGARRFGLKPLVIAGALLCSLQYPILAEIHGVDVWLATLIVVAAIGDTIYWTSYHAYFAALGDAEHRGHQISAREAVAAIVGIVSPLIAGWALTTLGPRVTFGVTGLVLVVSALPLLGTRNIAIADNEPGAFRAALPGFLLFAADGWMGASLMVWPIALFLSLGESFNAFGGAMAITALAGAASGLLLGRFIDAGHGARAVWLGVGTVVAVTLFRAISTHNPVMAVAATAAGAFLPALYVPTLMTAVYNQAQAAPCVLRFHIATEGGYDAGAACALLLAAGLLWAGAPISVAVLLALFGAAANFVMLRRYYGRVGGVALATP